MTGSDTTEFTIQNSTSKADLEGGNSLPDSISLPSASSLAEVLDGLNFAIILTDVNARVLHMNRGAKEIVRTSTGLKVAHGVLKAGTDLETIRLRQLIKKAAINADESGNQMRHFGVTLGEN